LLAERLNFNAIYKNRELDSSRQACR